MLFRGIIYVISNVKLHRRLSDRRQVANWSRVIIWSLSLRSLCIWIIWSKRWGSNRWEHVDIGQRSRRLRAWILSGRNYIRHFISICFHCIGINWSVVYDQLSSSLTHLKSMTNIYIICCVLLCTSRTKSKWILLGFFLDRKYLVYLFLFFKLFSAYWTSQG